MEILYQDQYGLDTGIQLNVSRYELSEEKHTFLISGELHARYRNLQLFSKNIRVAIDYLDTSGEILWSDSCECIGDMTVQGYATFSHKRSLDDNTVPLNELSAIRIRLA